MQSSHPEGRRWRSLPDVLAEHTRREDDHPLTPCLTSGVARITSAAARTLCTARGHTRPGPRGCTLCRADITATA